MRRRRETSASSRTAITESSTTSPGITDDDRSVEPNSETDLTEPEYLGALGSVSIHADQVILKCCLDGPISDLYAFRYCRTKAIEPSADPKWEDPEEALRQASPNDIHRFLNWCLKLKYGLDGRRLKGYRKASALEADWKYFRVYYTKVMKQKITYHLPCGQGIRHLIDKRGLDKQPRANVSVYVEDMVRFYLGFQRILLCLYNTIGLFTVNRKQAILHLQFNLQRDPHGGPPVPMIEIEPQFVKSVLGILKVNTFTLPEIIYSVSLVFSPHVLLFSILFYVNAFEVLHLTSMEDLRRLFIEDGRQEMPLPLKKEMDSYYIFPKVDVIDGEPCILWETRMNGSTLDKQLRSFSEIHSFLNHFFSHQFCYRGGELLNQSGINLSLFDPY
ncbi:hypothetical protein AO1008_00558 [Aspergillus oryzae 100-8]|nr:hypothetical protein AO1008_00558 [Aspergillus oryzae 100-8]